VDIGDHRVALLALDIHLIQLATGGCDLLDAELPELSLELAELLHQIILVLVPELTGLNLGRRLCVKSANVSDKLEARGFDAKEAGGYRLIHLPS
jgi:hypothetical protein